MPVKANTMKLKLWVPTSDSVLLQDNLREASACLGTDFGPALFGIRLEEHALEDRNSLTSYDLRLEIEFEGLVARRTLLHVIDISGTAYVFDLEKDVREVSAIWC